MIRINTYALIIKQKPRTSQKFTNFNNFPIRRDSSHRELSSRVWIIARTIDFEPMNDSIRIQSKGVGGGGRMGRELGYHDR